MVLVVVMMMIIVNLGDKRTAEEKDGKTLCDKLNNNYV